MRSDGVSRVPGPPPSTVPVEMGEPRETWCWSCKAFTRLTGDVLVLGPEGVTPVGTWTYCDICDDQEDPRA